MLLDLLLISGKCFKCGIGVVGSPNTQCRRTYSLVGIKISFCSISLIVFCPVGNSRFSDNRQSFNRRIPGKLSGCTDISTDILHERFAVKPCFRAIIILISKTSIRLSTSVNCTLSYSITNHSINALWFSVWSIVFVVVCIDVQIEVQTF